ncbi:MAG: DUF4870 family protein [Phenylobacterium sp.]|uniref:DUF4870 family protein n=1 Tax=Phenylobacterium sp. TaxID=1871053 RepID=UPI003918CD36
MSDPVAADPAPQTASEDKILPAVVYALYLVGVSNGLTVVLGLILAYVSKDGAGPKMRTHYDFLIRTFWMGLAWCVIGGLLVAVGIPLSFVLVGIPPLLLGGLILSLVGVWFIVRCVIGVIYLARDEAHPRPETWLI